MHHNYVAIIWEPHSGRQVAVAAGMIESLAHGNPRWTKRMATDGFALFDHYDSAGSHQPYVVGEDMGIVYGTLFRQGQREAVLPHALMEDRALMSATAGTRVHHLTSHYWGNYVAFLQDRGAKEYRVLRDCSGALPCYYACVAGASIVFSDLNDILPVAHEFTVNWKYLLASLAWPHLQIRETALESVSELLAGECLVRRNAHHSTYFAWDPVSIATAEPLLDSSSACAALRKTTQQSIAAWATRYDRILHTLSGGFDSTLVLAALSRAAYRPAVACINRFGHGPAEDERRYARIAASSFGVEILEYPWDADESSFNEQCLASPLTDPKPAISSLIGLLEAPFWQRILAARHPQAIWTGQGGDHLFISSRTELGIVDCLRLCGVGSDLARSIRDACVLTGHSIWRVMGTCLAVAFDERRFASAARWTPQTALLCREALPEDLSRYILHPWCLTSGLVPPGRRFQIIQLADVLNRHRPLPGLRSAGEFHPLLSQPILETVLRIPLYQLLRGGKTRGLAREAFADYIPLEICNRESKGQASTYFLTIYRRSAKYLRELLLDGMLVGKGLVSRSAVAGVLECDQPLNGRLYFPLFACIAAEFWARSWINRPACPRVGGNGMRLEAAQRDPVRSTSA